MTKLICPVPQECDREVSKLFIQNSIWKATPTVVAHLRATYMNEKKEIIGEDTPIEELYNKLKDFRLELFNRNIRRINHSIKHQRIGTLTSSAYQKLMEDFDPVKLQYRINMLSSMFSTILNGISKHYPNYTREEICNGIKGENGIISQVNIFEKILQTIYLYQYKKEQEINKFIAEGFKAHEEGNNSEVEKYAQEKRRREYEVNELHKIIANFDSLMLLVKIRLSKTENLSLNTKIAYASKSESDYSGIGEEDLNMEESIREHWSEKNDERSSFKSIGDYTRTILSSIIKGRDDLGFPIYYNPVRTHRYVQTMLRGVRSKSAMMYSMLKFSLMTPYKALFYPLLNIIDNNEKMQTAFFVDMKRGRQDYTQSKVVDGKVKVEKLNDSNSIDNYSTLLSNVKLKRSINKRIYNEEGKIKGKWKKEILDLLNSDTTPEVKVANLSLLLESLGFNVNSDTILGILSENSDLNSIYKSLVSINKNIIKDEDYSIALENIKVAKNIKNIARILNKHTAIVRNQQNRVSYKDGEGNTKTYDTHINPNFTSDFFDTIASFENEDDLKNWILDNYLISDLYYGGEINKNTNIDDIDLSRIKNLWLRELFANPEFVKNFEYDRFLGSERHPFEDFTTIQHFISVWQNYNSKGDEYARYPMFILGDSGVAKYITARKYEFNDSDIMNDVDMSNPINILYDIYLNELKRWENASELKSLGVDISNYTSNIGVFTLLPFLNNLTITTSDNKTIVLNKDTWRNKEILKDIDLEDEVKKAIKYNIEENVNSLKKLLESSGIVKINNGKVTSKELFGDSIKTNSAFEAHLRNFIYNYKIATISQLQIFAEDPAFYKNTEELQKRYKQVHAPGTKVDDSAIWEKNGGKEDVFGGGIERCIYLEDIELPGSEEFIETVKKTLGDKVADKYKKVSLTDGQGYRSLSSYRKVMIGSGKWTGAHENAYDIIMDIREKGRKLNADDIRKLNELAAVFQPIKPYLYEKEVIEDPSSGKKYFVPVQHKYAEVVLIPELLPDGILKDLATNMENNNIDVVLFDSCVKVGSWGVGKVKDNTSAIDANGNININTVMSQAKVHSFKYSSYRIQTNVPEDINGNHLMGTQPRKLILANIKKDVLYGYLKDKDGNVATKIQIMPEGNPSDVNGYNIVQLYNSIICCNILDSFSIFENKYLSNDESLSECLIQGIIYHNKEQMDKLYAYSLTEEGKILSPLFEPGVEYDSMSSILSAFKKIVNKQKILGGSLVQASAFGGGLSRTNYTGDLKFVVDPDNDGNILYAECEIPFDLSISLDDGTVVELDYNDWVNPDGTLKLSDEVVDKSHPRYKDFLSYKDSEGNIRIPEIEQTYPGILGIIAYRIPTERAYSMMNLKVKRFTKKTEGGVIRVPLEGTKIAGFDFDIDKLYLMRKEFAISIPEEDVSELWERFYDANPKIKNALKEAKLEAILEKVKQEKGYKKVSLSEMKEAFSSSKDRLYKYWKEAGLKGTPDDAFSYFVSYLYNEYKDNYDPSVSIYSQSKVARNNALIQIFQGRLSDFETMNARFTPGGFDNSKVEARIQREIEFGSLENVIVDGKVNWAELEERAKDKDSDPRPNYDSTDVETLLLYNQQNQIASKLIGVFANQNANHAFSSLMSHFSLKNAIKFGEYYENGLSDFLTPPNGVDTDLSMAEFLAASVDAVKEPVLNYLNYNTITANAAALLARLGYNTRDIGLLLNQPIIKEICDYKFNNQCTLTQAVNKVVSTKYKNIKVEQSDKSVSRDNLFACVLRAKRGKDNIANIISERDYLTTQINALEVFKQASAAAEELSEFITMFKFTAANSIGSTAGDMYVSEDKVASYIEKQEKGDSLLDIQVSRNNKSGVNTKYSIKELRKDHIKLYNLVSENPFAFENIMMLCYNEMQEKINEKYLPYENKTYKGAREFIKSLVVGNSLNKNDYNSIHTDFLTYLLSNVEASLTNPGYNGFLSSSGEGINCRDYYTKEFPVKLYKALEDGYLISKYPTLFSNMDFDYSKDHVDIKVSYFSLEDEDKNAFVQEWANLIDDPKLEELGMKGLAEDLFLYNFHMYGFQPNPRSFIFLTPTKVKENLKIHDKSYFEYLDLIRTSNNITAGKQSSDFARAYILNHTDNKKLVYKVPREEAKIIKEGGGKKGYYEVEYDETTSIVKSIKINIDLGKLEENPILRLLFTKVVEVDGLKFYHFKPCIRIGDNFYMPKGNSEQFNATEFETIIYELVQPLGKTNYTCFYPNLYDSTKPEVPNPDDDIDGSTSEGNGLSADELHTPTQEEEVVTSLNAIIKAMRDQGINDTVILNTLISLKNEGTQGDLLQEIAKSEKEIQENGFTITTSEGKEEKSCRR